MTKLRLSQIYQSILEKENKNEKKVPTGLVKITLEINDSEGVMYKMLDHIKSIGNGGHSFSIILDPDDKERELQTGWDGDGSDKIYKLDIEQLPKDYKQTPK